MDATAPRVNLKRPEQTSPGKSENGRPLLTCRFASYFDPRRYLSGARTAASALRNPKPSVTE
jgi:hypothetical protein